MNTNLEKYLESIQSTEPTTPSIMSRDTFFDIVNRLYETHIFSATELSDSTLFHIYYYGIPEGKKEFNIATVREASVHMALKPREWKNFFVFEDFDTAGAPAQNAALKLLEDCPDYAVIFLLVNNPKNLIGTIESRTISFFNDHHSTEVSDEISDLLEKFFQKNPAPWVAYMHKNDFSKEEVFSILTKVFWKLNYEQQKSCREIMIALEKINERPKNLLEKFFLWEDFF